MIVVRAIDDWKDIVVLTDKVYFIAGDYYESDEKEIVIDDGVALVNQGDHIAIIGSVDEEEAFMYTIKKSEFYKKLCREVKE